MIKETTINKYKTYIGKTIGSIKIEDIDLSKPNRIYFIGTCTSCNRKIKVRNDGLYPNRMGCSKCIGKWRSENFKKNIQIYYLKIFVINIFILNVTH